jgi:hypothetical protein
VESFVGCGNAICLAIEFDVKKVIPILMIFFLLTKSYCQGNCDELVFQIE